MKEPPASKGSPKIRLRFKAKDLERMDLEEMQRFLEAARQSEIEAEPESVEEEPVGVVPPELPEVVETEPGQDPSLWARALKRQPLKGIARLWSWLWLKTSSSYKGWVAVERGIQQHWKGIAIGCAGIAVVCFVIINIVGYIGSAISDAMAKKDWPDVPNTQLNLEWQARAEAGNPEAQYLWASHLAGELDEDPKPAPKVLELFDQAAKKEHPRATSAMRNLAWCYEYGVGTEEDAVQAEKWKKRANDAGLPVMDDAASDSRVSRAMVSGLVLLGWLGFLSAARGIWRRRLKDLSDAEREQMTAMVYLDIGSYARIIKERFGTLLLFAFFVGLSWAVYRAGVPAARSFFLAMVIGLPASALLLYIVSELRWDPFPEFDYHRGGPSVLQRSDTIQFHLMIRKLPLLFVLSLLLAQFFGLAWSVLLAISLVGLMNHREIDVLPQLDIWPGPDCRVSDPQRVNWFIRRLPLHIIYLLVFFTMGWGVLLVSIFFLEPAYIFSKSAIRQQFVIIQEKVPPRLEENTADMISRRLRYAPTMLSFWWALWVSLIICGALLYSVGDFSVAAKLGLLSLPGLAWFAMGAMLARMRDNGDVFQSFPWILFVAWILGLCAAALGGGGGVNPFITFVVVFGIALEVGLHMSSGPAKPLEGNYLKRQLFLSTTTESQLMGSWRIKSRQLLFTAGCIGMLLALGRNIMLGENLRQMVIGTFGIGLFVIFAIGYILMQFNVKLLPEKPLPGVEQPKDVLFSRYMWGVLSENAFLILAGATLLAWLVIPWQDIGGFDYFWARLLFLGIPIMCLLVCLGVLFLRYKVATGVVPRPWFHITAQGLQARWGMLLSAGILMAVLFVSAGIWIYGGEKSAPADIIEVAKNSYKVLDSGFLLPMESSP